MEENGHSFYGFPTVSALSPASVQSNLQKLGFGYRAKFIQQSADMIMKKKEKEQWLIGLRDRPYPEAKAELRTLSGVGPKV